MHFYTSAKVFLKIYDEKYAAYLHIVSNFLSQFTISHTFFASTLSVFQNLSNHQCVILLTNCD